MLTSLVDDFAGAGFMRSGAPQVDTNNDGILPGTLADQILNQGDETTETPSGQPGAPAPTLPVGPEVDLGTTIDNDVDPNIPGHFEITVGAGNDAADRGGVTVEDVATGQILINQGYIFQYSTHVFVGTTSLRLSATNVTQAPTLISDDTVESRGNFAGPNGTVEWIATSFFFDGVATLFSSVTFEGQDGAALGDFRVVSYLDEGRRGG